MNRFQLLHGCIQPSIIGKPSEHYLGTGPHEW